MEHVRSFSGFPGLAAMQSNLANENNNEQTHPFQTSELYSSKADTKIVDEELRRSRFRTFDRNEELFDAVDTVLQWLNESDSSFRYQLRRDDITETRYEANGRFLRHRDYLSVTSNLVDECTLILCVTPKELAAAVRGGETIVYPYASEEGTSFDTVTPGRGLLFRKDLEHAGNLLKAGEKHILTANIWATRKQVSAQVLFVTFPAADDEMHVECKAEKQDNEGTKKQQPSTPEASLHQIASQGNSYALPVDCLKGSMLEAHVRFANREYEQEDEQPPEVVPYFCSDFTYEEFSTVAKILLCMYIQEDEITKHAEAIDFFGPFAAESLLVNLAVEQEDKVPPSASASSGTISGSEEKTCKRFVQPTNVKDLDGRFPSNKKVKSEASTEEREDTEDFGVIVCENESRTKVVYEAARTLVLTNYVPFKTIFVQGIFLHGRYDERVNVSVTPAGLVVGDYNHIFGIQNIGGRRSVKTHTIEEYHTKHNYFSSPNPTGWDAETGTLFKMPDMDDEEGWSCYDEDINYEQVTQFRSKSCGLGLKLALGDENAREKLSEYVLANPDSDNYYGGVDPSGFFPLSEFLDQQGSSNDDDSPNTSLFHRDASGMATFTMEEAEAASNYIASMNLDGRVKAALQKKRFELSQEMEEKDDYYCNESTYSNLSILFVTGLVRLDASVDATSTAVAFPDEEFDAWPTKEHLAKEMSDMRAHFEELGIAKFLPSSIYDEDY